MGSPSVFIKNAFPARKEEAAEVEIQRILKPLDDAEVHIYLQPRKDSQPPYGGGITYEKAVFYCRVFPEIIPVSEGCNSTSEGE